MQQLHARWTEEQATFVVDRLCDSRPESPFPPLLQAATSLIDLRGLPINRMLRDLDVSGVDLSHSRLGPLASIVDVSFTDVFLDRAHLGPNLSGRFERCSFDAARLRRLTFHGATFTDCTFADADFSHAHGKVTAYHCSFRNACFKGALFLSGRFENCAWQGCRFMHASLARSSITRDGFPEGVGITPPDAILPPVILDNVRWL